MTSRKTLLALCIASVSTVAMGDYVGTLRPAKSSLMPALGFYSFSSPAVLGLAPGFNSDPGYRIKLGYRTSRIWSVESEIFDGGRPGTMSPFTSPANLASAFRSTGFAVDTVATLPYWNKFSVYGRFGAVRGDVRPLFAPYSTSLLADTTRGTRLRYGLGMSYDFTKAFGIRAELERYSPLGHPLPTDAESDLISVGVLWRF
jgi:OOP family OmpA-OmpF porin